MPGYPPPCSGAGAVVTNDLCITVIIDENAQKWNLCKIAQVSYFVNFQLLHIFICGVCVCVLIRYYDWLLVGFVALRPKSTAMVIAGRSVHLTTLFPGQAWTSG